MVMIRLAQLPPGQDVSMLISKLEALEKRLAGGSLPAVPQAAARPASPAPSAPTPVEEAVKPVTTEPLPADLPAEEAAPPADEPQGKDWSGLVDFVKSRRVRIGSFLEHGRLLINQLPHLKIALPNNFYGLADKEMKEEIQTLATEYFSQQVRLDIVCLSDKDTAPPSLLEERKQLESDREKRLKHDAVEHPMVKAAVDIFEGEIDNVRPIDKGFV